MRNLCITSMVLFLSATCFSAELLPNGDLESDPGIGKIPGWSTVPRNLWVRDGFRGESYLRIAQRDPGRRTAIRSDEIKIPAGQKTLYCSAWIRAKNVGGDGALNLGLDFYSAAGKELGSADIDKTKECPPEWRKIRSAVTLPDGTERVRVRFELNKVSGVGELDNIRISMKDFGQVGAAFDANRHIFRHGEKINLTLTATQDATVEIRNYNEAVVNAIRLKGHKPKTVSFTATEPGIYWITHEDGAFINTFAVIVPVKIPANSEPWRFGVHYPYSTRDPGTYIPELDYSQLIGAVWLRCNTGPTADLGQQSWQERDRFISEMKKRGLQMLTFFEDYNFPARIQSHWTHPEALKLIAQYVSHYKGQLKYFEVWNEANMKNIDDYFAFHKYFYEAVKQADSEAKVVQTGIATPGKPGEWGCKHLGPEFQEGLLKRGSDRVTDVFNFHFYPYQWKTLDIVEKYRDIYRKYKVDRPVWVTENGMAADIGNLPQQRQQAEYLVRSAVTCLSLGAEKYFWFLSLDHPAGLFGLIDANQRPKAAYVAYGVMAGLLGESKYVGPVKLGSKAIEGYTFRNSSETVSVLWSKSGTVELSTKDITPSAAKVTFLDLMGRQIKPARDVLAITPTPIFMISN